MVADAITAAINRSDGYSTVKMAVTVRWAPGKLAAIVIEYLPGGVVPLPEAPVPPEEEEPPLA